MPGLMGLITEPWRIFLRLSLSSFLFGLEQLLILLAHLALLGWMIYTLYEGGTWSLGMMVSHFAGMAVYGGLLIWICAFRARRRFENEQKALGQKKK